MKLVYQTDDRLDDSVYGQALTLAANLIADASEFAGAEYKFYHNPLEYGSKLNDTTFLPQYFADVAIMIELLETAEIGDILVYVDTDVVSYREDSIKQLIDYIENSDKHFFITSTITAFNAGLFAIKVNEEMKQIFPKINWSDCDEHIETKFGTKYTPNEIPVIYAIRDNFMNINNQICFLPNDTFNVRPDYKVIEDDFEDGLPRPTKKTCLVHFLTKNGKEELVKYFDL